MPGPYGSLAKPVELDPFSRIVGVHWGNSLPTHIAFDITLKLGIDLGFDESCTGSGIPFPTTAYWSIFLTSLQYVFDTGTPISSIRLMRKNIWDASTISGSGVTASLPVLPDEQSFAPWVKTATFGSFLDFSISGSKGVWKPLSGSDLAIPVPGYSDRFFVDTLSADLAVWGDTFTGDPICIEDFGPSKWAPCTGDSNPEGYANASEYGDASLSIAGLTATFPHGDTPATYHARGLHLVGGFEFKDGHDFEAVLWMLFERADLNVTA